MLQKKKNTLEVQQAEIPSVYIEVCQLTIV